MAPHADCRGRAARGLGANGISLVEIYGKGFKAKAPRQILLWETMGEQEISHSGDVFARPMAFPRFDR